MDVVRFAPILTAFLLSSGPGLAYLVARRW